MAHHVDIHCAKYKMIGRVHELRSIRYSCIIDENGYLEQQRTIIFIFLWFGILHNFIF